jgi:hypothetical protein
MSFRYHATLSPKPHFNKKEFIVEGWSEKELLKTLGDINDRYFTVNVGDGDKVVMDIHFIESLMVCLNKTGDLYEGLDITERKQFKVDLETFKKLFGYLKQHNESQDIKMPLGSLDFLMMCFSWAPKWLSIINTFEEENPDLVKRTRKSKVDYLRAKIKEEGESMQNKAAQRFEINLSKMNEYFENAMDSAIDNDNYSVMLHLEQQQRAKDEEIHTQYGEEILKIVTMQDIKEKKLDESTMNTYAFVLEEFDILVSKVDEKTLKLRTMYPPKKWAEPKNCFLYIPDYGMTAPKMKKF